MIKNAHLTNLTYDISDKEKSQAEKALLFFNHSIKLLDMAKEHLDIMYTPFKDNPSMSSDEVMKARAALRRFRDKSVSNFNEFKKAAFHCVRIMQVFESDTQTTKLIKSFISSIDDLENSVNKFVDIFNNLEDKDFANNVISSITDIQKKCEEIEEIVEDRIKKHIQTNILARTWVDGVSNELNLKLEQKNPLILDLFNQQQNQLNDIITERSGKQ